MNKKIKRALISVSDKSQLVKILPTLKKFKIEILSSGGTFKYIRKNGYKCIEVSDFTNFKEILDGRVKTLHPKIHSGILFKRGNKKHLNQMKVQNFKNIDLVIVNFYPFEKTVLKTKNESKIIENIDIGGPALVRSAAKNFKDVVIITSNYQLENLAKEMSVNKGSTSLKFRKVLSQEAFNETAYYDSNISNYFNKITDNKNPEKITFSGRLISKLRYGENPHQSGALYSRNNLNELEKLNGKELSYNNYNDIYYGLDILNTLPKGIGTIIIKHANPSGISIDKKQLLSFNQAFNCDPVSAFGGIIICNYKVKYETAKEINKKFFEVVVAKDFEGNISIVDYKTSKRYGHWLPEEYYRQLIIYALMYYEETGVVPKFAGIDWLRYDDIMLVAINDENLREARELIKGIHNEIKKRGDDVEQYEMVPQTLCKWCAFYKKPCEPKGIYSKKK